MKVTTTFHVAKTELKWRGVANHVRHIQGQHHRNKDIDFGLTKYNGELVNIPKKQLDAFYNQHQNALKKFIKEHDEKAIKQGHKNRAYGSVKGWLNKQKSIERVGLVTFGNLDTKNAIMAQTGMNKEEFAQISFDALVKWANLFNKAHQNLKLSHFMVNVDELGAPHAHIAFRALSFSDKGKPSTNFDKAIARELGYKGSSKQALKTFRQQEDQRIIDAFNATFKEKGIQFQLQRTNSSIHGLSMETFKDMKHQDSKQKKRQKELDTTQEEITQQQATLNQRDAELRKREAKLKTEQKEVNNAITNVYNDFNNTSLQLAWQGNDEDIPETMAIIKKHIDNHDCDFARDEQNKPLLDKQGYPKIIKSKGFFGDLFSQAVIVCERLGQNIIKKVKEHMKSWEDIMNQKYQENLEDLQANKWQPKTHSHHVSQHQNDDGMGL